MRGVARNELGFLLVVLGDTFVGSFSVEEGMDVDIFRKGLRGDDGAIVEVMEGFPEVEGRQIDAADAEGGMNSHEKNIVT